MSSITCRELIDFLEDYRTGALPDEQRRVFEEHLVVCPPCKDYLDSYETTIRLGRQALECEDDDGPPPEEVPQRLIDAILAAHKRNHE